MHTANLRSSRPITVLGTVMGVTRDGNRFIHDVDATAPDGTRISIQVVATRRHLGGVSVRWNPQALTEPRFVSTRPWGLYVLVAIVVIAAAIGIWLLLT